MGLASTAVIGSFALIYNALEPSVIAEIASTRDKNGRCVDVEVLLRNDTKADATDIEIAFAVDHFTTQGTITLEYGDERDQMIPSGQKTLLQRQPYIPIQFRFDPSANVLHVPRLQPTQYLHFYFGGESVNEQERANSRERLLAAQDPSVMDMPHVTAVTRKDGSVLVKRAVKCKE
ncbi:hypothetical protein [Dechloromonas denitrificans]|uniref:hypothetical protein n=1 Tax=Dechloromonas denitrificans TaxID=281362 RepID=UPI001CF85CC4|nr:hypothetical protein [Dechloromonas denitrificans]UCV04961.1 hypothetical protein KI611_06810 [Dechloromonas denitrificans]